MKRSLPLVVLAMLAGSAHAEESDLSIGLGVGVATGPNLQVKTSWRSQLDLGIGLHYNDSLRLQLDHAWRFAFIRGEHMTMPFYLGVGGFVSDFRRADAGLRVPLGLQMNFHRAPIQLFGELAGELVVLRDRDRDMDPPGQLGVSGLVGVRASL